MSCFSLLEDDLNQWRVYGGPGGENGYAKFDAEQIARGLNLLVQYGKESLPNVKEHDFADLNLGDD